MNCTDLVLSETPNTREYTLLLREVQTQANLVYGSIIKENSSRIERHD